MLEIDGAIDVTLPALADFSTPPHEPLTPQSAQNRRDRGVGEFVAASGEMISNGSCRRLPSLPEREQDIRLQAAGQTIRGHRVRIQRKTRINLDGRNGTDEYVLLELESGAREQTYIPTPSSRPRMADSTRPPHSIIDLIGHTPMIPLERIARGLPYRLYAKLEFLNPGGSVKDRIGVAMIDEAESRGLLKPGGTIIEATSGNTGAGLALVAAVRGYRAIFVIPDKMSSEKIRLLRAFGARVVVTPSQLPPDHPMSHYSVARRLAKETPDSYYPNQYENPLNPMAHYRTTGPEIDREGGQELGAIVGTVGTGGTMSGVGRYFKERRPAVRIVAVDPVGSVLSHYFRTKELIRATPYQVEGIGEDIVPKTIHFEFLDEFVEVNDRESFEMARRLAREEGLFVGGSSGSAVAGALHWLAKRPLPDGMRVVVILPDSGDRYLSKFYSDDWLREKGFADAESRAVDLLRMKETTPALVSAHPTTTVRDALALLRHHGISQLPVLSAAANVGSLQEDEILRRMLGDETVLDRTVQAVLQPPFPEVASDASIAEVLRQLAEHRAILVRDAASQEVRGVLTRNDVLGFLADRGDVRAL
jgi:cystathionine beta-synthase